MTETKEIETKTEKNCIYCKQVKPIKEFIKHTGKELKKCLHCRLNVVSLDISKDRNQIKIILTF